MLLLVMSLAMWQPMTAVAEDVHSPASGEAADHADQGGSIANPLFWDPDLAIFTVVVFLCLLLVLRKFAWGPIVNALEAREQTVVDHLAAAAEKHEEAKGLLAAHEARLATAKDEVREMLEEARRDAEATKGQIVAEADAAARAHRDRAVRDIDQARGGALRDLAEKSANLAVDLAGNVVQQNLSKEQQAELVRDAITKLTSSSPN
ncbi:MAG: F0F1 ATP synthase subunit B [Aeoliella sp.]